MTCNDCLFFKAPDGKDNAGLCRRNPPSLFLMNHPTNGKIIGGTSNQSQVFMSQFPPTFPDNWCGAFEEA